MNHVNIQSTPEPGAASHLGISVLPNNGGVPAPIDNTNRASSSGSNNVNLTYLAPPTWCRIQSTALHGEGECPELKAAMDIVQKEMQNLELVPNEQPSTSNVEQNPSTAMVFETHDEEGQEGELTPEEE